MSLASSPSEAMASTALASAWIAITTIEMAGEMGTALPR